MIKFDFNSTVYDYNCELLEKENVIDKLNTYDMIGWKDEVKKDDYLDMINKVNEIKSHSKVLLVIGIGGSFLGSKALYDMFKGYFKEDFKVLYAGYSLSSDYLNDLIESLKDEDLTINVISKSGNTMEIKLAYNLFKKFMIEKYGEDAKNRIIITTGNSGYLHDEAISGGYYTMSIPDNIGGRYSMMTPAHLFPLAFNIDILKLIDGYNSGDNFIDDAYKYSCNRKMLYDNGFVVENFVTYEPKYTMFNEWLKQLFGESEGKDRKGIFPTSTVFTRDLHSLGQFIQEGSNILFETVFVTRKNKKLIIDDVDLNDVENNVIDAVRIAHYKGNNSINFIELDELNEYDIGAIVKFFFYSAAFSSILFGVNPFNQPGVEVYKSEVRNKLENK